MNLLSVRNLSVDFKTSDGVVQALRNVSFDLRAGESLGLVGESGSGKSVTALSILQLLAPNASIRSGEILWKGRDLLALAELERRQVRGQQVAMVFQDPMTSLNPCFTVGDQICEVLQFHQSLSRAQARAKAQELLRDVGLDNPERRLGAYPHELSGGMNQRVMIAMAVACAPELLIADEPTTALDVTIQAQILDLLQNLRRQRKMALILVSHDLGVVAKNADRILVMYAGEVAESGPAREVIRHPRHPYTQGLLKSLPGLYPQVDRDFRLPMISGMVPDLRSRPMGCQFALRCQYRQDVCERKAIELTKAGSCQVRCLFPLNMGSSTGVTAES